MAHIKERKILQRIASRVDIVRHRSADDVLTFTFVGKDITPDTVIFTIKDMPGGTVLFTDTNTVGQHLDPAAADGGTTQFTVPDDDATLNAQLSTTDASLLWYEVELVIISSGNDERWFEGDFVSKP